MAEFSPAPRQNTAAARSIRQPLPVTDAILRNPRRVREALSRGEDYRSQIKRLRTGPPRTTTSYKNEIEADRYVAGLNLAANLPAVARNIDPLAAQNHAALLDAIRGNNQQMDARMLELNASMQQNDRRLNARMLELNARMPELHQDNQQMQIVRHRLEDLEVMVVNFNARLPESPILPRYNNARNLPPADFPNTLRGFSLLPDDRAAALLHFYGLPPQSAAHDRIALRDHLYLVYS